MPVAKVKAARKPAPKKATKKIVRVLKRYFAETPAKPKNLDGEFEKLKGVSLNATHIGEPSIGDFEEWFKELKSVRSADMARNRLYYGFQPMYDALISGSAAGSQRPKAVRCLQSIVNSSVEFLTSYYLGKPDLGIVRDLAEQIESDKSLPVEVGYTTKFRNIDSNQIFPRSVHGYLVDCIGRIVKREIERPTLVIGCACGSSEIAMPLAGMLGCGLSFIRRSKRRGDDDPLVLSEHEHGIRTAAKDNVVFVVEDYVCSGGSIKRVMEKMVAYGASKVYGTSIRNSHDDDLVKELVAEDYFHLYELKR